MKIEMRKASDLIPYHNNPRINDGAVNHVASSIKEFGWKVPLVIDAFNVIVTGHTRLKAAQKLGLEEVPCIQADDLTPAQIKAFRIADNKTSEFSTWDLPLLDMELAELKELDFDYDFGFEDDELFHADNEGLTDEDAIPEEVDPICQTGDLWQLGEHRLLCGDATKKDDVERLMQCPDCDGTGINDVPTIKHDCDVSDCKRCNGDGIIKADMVFTDPPYGMDAVKNSGVLSHYRDVKNDNSNEVAIKAFKLLNKSNHIKDFAPMVWFGANYYSNSLPNESCWFVWDKNNGGSDQMDCELAWTNIGGVTRKFTQASEKQNRVHPTQKPISLYVWGFEKIKAETVLDPFLGSGSTLIACEKTNRKCYGMEIDPHYCDVIIKRWEDYTGQKAVKL